MEVIRVLLVAAHLLLAGIWFAQIIADWGFSRARQGAEGKAVELPLLMAQVKVLILMGQIGGIGVLLTGYRRAADRFWSAMGQWLWAVQRRRAHPHLVAHQTGRDDHRAGAGLWTDRPGPAQTSTGLHRRCQRDTPRHTGDHPIDDSVGRRDAVGQPDRLAGCAARRLETSGLADDEGRHHTTCDQVAQQPIDGDTQRIQVGETPPVPVLQVDAGNAG